MSFFRSKPSTTRNPVAPVITAHHKYLCTHEGAASFYTGIKDKYVAVPEQLGDHIITIGGEDPARRRRQLAAKFGEYWTRFEPGDILAEYIEVDEIDKIVRDPSTLEYRLNFVLPILYRIACVGILAGDGTLNAQRLHTAAASTDPHSAHMLCDSVELARRYAANGGANVYGGTGLPDIA